jgi:hypothetical protein
MGVDNLLNFAKDELKKARIRLEESGEQPIPVTITLAAIESLGSSTWTDWRDTATSQ